MDGTGGARQLHGTSCVTTPLEPTPVAAAFEAQLRACQDHVHEADTEVNALKLAMTAFGRPGVEVQQVLQTRTALREAKLRLETATARLREVGVECVVAATRAVVVAHAGMAVASDCTQLTVAVVLPHVLCSDALHALRTAWKAQAFPSLPGFTPDAVRNTTLVFGGQESGDADSRSVALTVCIAYADEPRTDTTDLVVWDRATSEALVGKSSIAEKRQRLGLR
jgi:hypothetical protein